MHADAAMFVGGLRALLLQSLHPLAMAGVAGHSGYRGDPWGRLQRTSYFLAVTTFGTRRDAEAMIARIRAIHHRVKRHRRRTAAATPPPTRTCCGGCTWPRWTASCWPTSATAPGRWTRPAGTATSPTRPGSPQRSACSTRRGPRPNWPRRWPRYRPELAGTAEARDAARFMLLQPPLPLLARAPYAVLAAAAVASLPRWARWPLRLPYLPVAEATVVRLAGDGLVRAIRWAMTPPPAAA